MKSGWLKVATMILVATSHFLVGCRSLLPESSVMISGGPFQVAKTPGVFRSPAGDCEASIDIAEMGGFLILSVTRSQDKKYSSARDVTGAIWVGKHELVYTISPIYGKPGLYLIHCPTMVERRIVSPQTLSSAYPDGADYFELESVEFAERMIVRFYYAPNVDDVDFSAFRSSQHLQVVEITTEQEPREP